jgi:hypothetical protein
MITSEEFKKMLEPEPPKKQIEPPADPVPKESPKKKGFFGKK